MTTHDRCPVCRAARPPDASVCHVCGTPLPSKAELPDARSESQAGQTDVQAEILALLARMDHRLSDIERRAEASDQRLLRLEGKQAQPAVVQSREKPAAAPRAAVSPPPPLLAPVSSFKPAAVSPTPPITPTPAPAAQRPAAPITAPRGGKSATDWERLVGGRGLAWTGALALIIGAVFFLSLAFSRGWIGPTARVVIGVAVATLCIAGGAWFFNRREALFGYAMSAVGLGVMSLSMYAATQLYDLVRIEIGLAGALCSAIAAAVIAIRFNAPIVAAFGIIAALAAPPILGASTNGTTILYLGATLIGVAAISLYQSWNWLPLLAFVLAAPQATVWFSDDASRGAGFVALGAFWLLFAICACAPEFRTRQMTLRKSSPILLFLNAIFLVQSGFMLLGNADITERWGGVFLFAVAAVHGAIAAIFIRKYGDRHAFGLLAAAFGLIALAVAVPLQFNGPVVAIIWASVAVPFTWYADRNSHLVSRIAGISFFALAIAHLFSIEYPLGDISIGLDQPRPFLNAAGGTLAALLAAMAVAGYLVKSTSVRSNLTVIGLGMLLLAMPFELSNTALITGWMVAGVLALAISRLRIVQTIDQPFGFDRTGRIRRQLVSLENYWPGSGGGRELLAITAGLLGIVHLMRFELPLRSFADWVRPDLPFTDRPTLTVAIMVAAMALAILATPFSRLRRAIAIAAPALVAYLLPFQVSWPATIFGWSLLGIGLMLAPRWDTAGLRGYRLASKLLLSLGTLAAFSVVAPPHRLLVDANSVIDHPFLWSGATVAFGSLAIAFALSAWFEEPGRSRVVMGSLAGALAIYLGSVAIVDEFQRRIGAGTPFASLQKRAQVALSIFWAITGGLIFAAGIVRFGQAVRIFGLALLALATAKVFIYDLSSLDTSYRVLSFVGLGVLLLISSYLYQHFVAADRAIDESNDNDTPPPASDEAPSHERWHFHRAH